jgi:site-specific DNA-methyltransferase (adenine-specific)
MLEFNKEYLMDYMDLFKEVPDKAFDLAPVDFPYGIGEAGKNHKSRNTLVRQKGGQLRRCPSSDYSRKDWDDKVPDQIAFDEVFRISKNQLFFGANYMMDKINGTGNFKTPRREQFDEFLKEHDTGWIIWDKCNGGNDFNDCELIYSPSYQFESFSYKYMWNGMMQGKSIFEGHIMQGDKSKNEKRIHPTQKPVNLYRFLYHYFKPKSIVDPSAGSYSSIIAAIRDNINYLAGEKDKEYFDKGTNRIRNEKSQYSVSF